MELGPALYRAVAKTFRLEPVMRLKDAARPVKHFLFGKKRLYKAIERAAELERKRGREVATVFDIGAAIGEATLPLARAFPRATLYCFEPIPASFARLRKRTARFRDRIHYYNCALSHTAGTADFFVLPFPDASSLIPQREAGVKKITVPTRRLDDVVKEERLQSIQFMKIDVEGAEKEVLEGGRYALAHLVDTVFVEISPLRKGLHAHDYIDVFEYLHQAGFTFADVYGDYFFTKLL